MSHSHLVWPYAQLKTLRIILKNLADPTKSNDPKYRSIKVSKLSAKFNPCPSATEYLKAIGFKTIHEDGEEVMRIENVDISDMNAVMVELSNALDMVTPEESAGEEKKVEYERGASSLSTTSSSTGKMSEKQKARMLMEKKERDEREEAKRARKKTQAQIKQGKLLFGCCCYFIVYIYCVITCMPMLLYLIANYQHRQICQRER